MSKSRVIIHEINDTDGLYSVHLDGSISTMIDIDVESDYLIPEEAHEIASSISEEYRIPIEWEGSVPGWAQ